MPVARTCADCDADITGRPSSVVRCAECQPKAEKVRIRRARAERNANRVCAECGDSIAHRAGQAKYCEGCAYRVRLRKGRRYQRERLARDPGYRKVKRGSGRNWSYRRHLVVLVARQAGRCGICGGALGGDDPTKWHVDHIRPRCEGGGDEEGNLQVTHAHCNESKADRWEGTDGAQMLRWARWRAVER